jgi:hypothetical protein
MSIHIEKKNISLQILIDFLKNYINTDDDSVNIKLAKSLVDKNSENYNMVVNSYYDFYKTYKKFFLGGQVELDINDSITDDHYKEVDSKSVGMEDCCNSAEYFSCLQSINKYNIFKELVEVYEKFIENKVS